MKNVLQLEFAGKFRYPNYSRSNKSPPQMIGFRLPSLNVCGHRKRPPPTRPLNLAPRQCCAHLFYALGDVAVHGGGYTFGVACVHGGEGFFMGVGQAGGA